MRLKRGIVVGLLLAWLGGCDAPRADEPIGLMTFNIRYDNPADGPNAWPNRMGSVVELIERQAPDIAGLQEAMAHQTRYLAGMLGDYRWIGRTRGPRDGDGEGCPIFYRHDRWRLDDHGTFWLSDTPQTPGSTSFGNDLPRIATWAKLTERTGGRTIYVYNCHLDHRSQPSRVGSTALIVERIGRRAGPGELVVFMGDFNAGETNPALEPVRRAGLVDTFRAARPNARAVGTFHAWRGKTGGAKIDHIFVSGGLATVNANILRDHEGGRYPSDHYPVTATVRMGATDAE